MNFAKSTVRDAYARGSSNGSLGLEAGEDVKCESGGHFCFLAICENIDLSFIIWNLSLWLKERVKAILFIKVYSKIS